MLEILKIVVILGYSITVMIYSIPFLCDSVLCNMLIGIQYYVLAVNLIVAIYNTLYLKKKYKSLYNTDLSEPFIDNPTNNTLYLRQSISLVLMYLKSISFTLSIIGFIILYVNDYHTNTQNIVLMCLVFSGNIFIFLLSLLASYILSKKNTNVILHRKLEYVLHMLSF
jgi:hypothetical protein